MKNIIRPFYKYWPVAVVLIIIAGWPEVNDWQWASAKEEARSLITKYETERDLQDKAQAAGQAGGAASASSAPAASALAPATAAKSVSVEMSKLTCIAANSFYTPFWHLSTSYRVKLIQAFIWHGYGVEIPNAKSVGERGCGLTDDGKYLFLGS